MKVHVIIDKNKNIYAIYLNQSIAHFVTNDFNKQEKEGSPFYLEAYALRDDY